MNGYFIPGEGRRDFPERSYAKLDQIEPSDSQDAETVVLSFDAVDAEWDGFTDGNIFAFELDDQTEGERQMYWRKRFKRGEKLPPRANDPFERLPLYRIELTLRRGDAWFRQLVGLEETWVEIQLSKVGRLAVDVYGGLFMPAVPARISHPPKPTPMAQALDRVFGMDDWLDAAPDELDAALARTCNIQQLLVFDVGQGSANALVCVDGCIMYYYDVGCGVYRNAPTRPSKVTFCTHEPPVVLLSHWDADHWSGANLDTRLLALTWIAPRQSVTVAHVTFANNILKAGGTILIVGHHTPPVAWSGHAQSFELRRCMGRGRNGSSLAFIVEDNSSQRAWLLTGDAAYNYIPPPIPSDLAAVVVPHHGADMGSASIPPRPSAHAYSRLVYSFGPGNAHGSGTPPVRHPTPHAVSAHTSAGWTHSTWSPPPPAMNTATSPVLATATHLATHEDGIAIGWISAPAINPLNGRVGSCPDVMPVNQH